MSAEFEGDLRRNLQVTDSRLTFYWIGWAFFGITIASIFIAGVMVSMYKMENEHQGARTHVPKEVESRNSTTESSRDSLPHSTIKRTPLSNATADPSSSAVIRGG